MSAHVILNLLNKLEKMDKMGDSITRLISYTGARMLTSFYHMILKLL